MKRALLGIIGLALTACGAVAAQQYDMAKVEADFKACMNATGPASSPIEFSNKVDACEHAAWAVAYSRVQR